MNIENTEIIRSFIKKNAKDKFFSVEFIKKNGQIRKMTCRLGVKPKNKKDIKIKNNSLTYIKFCNPRIEEEKRTGVMTVFDVNKVIGDKRGAYRRINLKSIKNLKIKGIEYNICDILF